MTYEDICENVGLKVKFYRQRLHLTQLALAEKIEMDVRYLSDIERGKKNITLKTLYRLASALNINIDELFQMSLPHIRV